MRFILIFFLFLLFLPLLTACDQEQSAEPESALENTARAPEEPLAGEIAETETAAPEEETEDDFDYDGLPPGTGREEVFVNCSSCHSLKLVQQQGLSPHRWEEILDWMVEEQGMTPLEPPERERVINYLSTHYGPPQ